MSTLLIGLLIVIYTMQSLLCRKYSEHYPGEQGVDSQVFTIVSGAVVAAISFAFNGFDFEAADLTILLGIMNGLALAVYNGCMIKASQHGPYSILVMFMLTGGILLPTFTAVAFFQEQISVAKAILILVLFISVYMTSYKTDGAIYKNKTVFWLSCIGLFLSNGVYGSLLDAQRRITTASQKEEMVMLTYLCAMLLSALILVRDKGKNTFGAMKQTSKSCIYLLTCSVTVALGINLMVYILPLVNVIVLYAVVDASVLLTSILISRIFFREPMSRLNWAGSIIMCVAMAGISCL